ncbi:MAG: ABC transporter ATP-binding protein, partial [Stomatobaculum sp.]|nr:ABC transporter ATP-binding protein [Stomatobaculum sp.]
MEFEVRGGSFGYPGENEILKNISFTAGPGSAVTILGPNGAGKTTLLRCMLGFLPWSSGQTLLDGKDLQQIPSAALWKKVAYVPQAKVLAFPGTCFDMVLLGRSAYLPLFGVPGKRDREAAMRAMERAGIARLSDRNCGQISGGEL